MNVSRQGKKLPGANHVDALFAHSTCCLAKVQLFGHGNHEHVMLFALAHGNQGLEHAIGVFVQKMSHLHAGKGGIGGEGVDLVGDLGGIEGSYGVDLGILLLSHGLTFLGFSLFEG